MRLCRIGSMKDLGYPLDSRWYLRDFFVAGSCVLECENLMASPFTKPLKTLLGWQDE